MSAITLGQRILLIRGKVSRKDFASEYGIGTATLQRYENDSRSPDIEFLVKLQQKTGWSLDYLVHGKEISLNTDEALVVEKYRNSSNEVKNKVLLTLIGGIENVKELAAPNTDNKENKGVIGDTTGEVSIDNSTDKSSDNSNQQGVFNSPHSPISNSFNTQSGFTELPFIWACAVCGSMAWLLAAAATYKLETDALLSLSFGWLAILLWVVTMVMAGFGYSIGKKKFDEVQEKLGHHA